MGRRYTWASMPVKHYRFRSHGDLKHAPKSQHKETLALPFLFFNSIKKQRLLPRIKPVSQCSAAKGLSCSATAVSFTTAWGREIPGNDHPHWIKNDADETQHKLHLFIQSKRSYLLKKADVTKHEQRRVYFSSAQLCANKSVTYWTVQVPGSHAAVIPWFDTGSYQLRGNIFLYMR